MLEQSSIELAEPDLAHLHDDTAGNPRLVELFITLPRTGEPLSALLQRLSFSPSLEFLVGRIWWRLDAEEQRLLKILSVFRLPAPSDARQEEQAVLSRLMAHHLVRRDGQGGVSLLPALRSVIYTILSPEDRETYHLLAADIRVAHGQYTAAAYHYLTGGRPEMAIWIWYTHREQAINQGQAETALALFGQISQTQLCPEDREVLMLLRGELRLLTGEYSQAREDLQSISWHPERVSAFHARRLEGNLSRLARLKANQAGLYIDLGQLEVAIAPAEEALALFMRLGESYGKVHAAHNLAEAHLAVGNLEEAARYAWMAIQEDTTLRPYSLLTLSGVRLAQQQLAEAEDFGRQSVAAAEQNEDYWISAYAWRSLGEVYLAQQNKQAARAALERALEMFGDLALVHEIDKTRTLLNDFVSSG